MLLIDPERKVRTAPEFVHYADGYDEGTTAALAELDKHVADAVRQFPSASVALLQVRNRVFSAMGSDVEVSHASEMSGFDSGYEAGYGAAMQKAVELAQQFAERARDIGKGSAEYPAAVEDFARELELKIQREGVGHAAD